MTKHYLLDTNICVFYFRGKYDINKKIASVGIENCFLSEITVAELYYGAENSKFPSRTMKETESFISLFKIVPISDVLHVFGREKAYLTSIGKTIENFDMAIGATALKYNMVLVTDNLSHLGRIRGIKTENWKEEFPK